MTGFCVADLPQPAAETDGPPGALYLAHALVELDTRVELISDCFGRPLLECGMRTLGLELPLHELAINEELPTPWVHEFLQQRGYTHLVAIETRGTQPHAGLAACTVAGGTAAIGAVSRTGPGPTPETGATTCAGFRSIT